MMTVEEKPDVTYNDVGGCKEQIEKMREVIMLNILHISYPFSLVLLCNLNFGEYMIFTTTFVASLYYYMFDYDCRLLSYPCFTLRNL